MEIEASLGSSLGLSSGNFSIVDFYLNASVGHWKCWGGPHETRGSTTPDLIKLRIFSIFFQHSIRLWLVGIRPIRSGLFLVSEWVLRDDCSSYRDSRIWSPGVYSSCFEV